MRGRDLRELRAEGGVKVRRLVVVHGGLRAHVGNDGEDLLGARGLRTKLLLELSEKHLALVDAADEVVRRRDDAVRRSLHVVGDDHLLAVPAGGLVEGAQLPEVGLRLAEAPLRVQGGGVELGERHAARAVRVHLHERGLHGGALGVPEVREGPGDASDHLVRVVEGVVRREGVAASAGGGRGRVGALERHLRDVSVREGDHLLPVGDAVHQEPLVLQRNPDALLVVPQHPVDHVIL
mmetsp:Transcript_56431/g.175062  ORF Transcript_56431/g.175062 Transcript_56431/m.175062 type:complete len:237 (+) Transcript_56431:523-1233(+)